jgi:Cytochrome c554 and c-prime
MSITAWKQPAIPWAFGSCSRYLVLSLLAAHLLSSAALRGQTAPVGDAARETRDRVNSQRWWPTKSTVPFAAFAGEKSCSTCHAGKASSQATTPMAQAAARVAQRGPSSGLATGPAQVGPYLYQITSDRLGSRLTVSIGKQALTANIAWVFGANVRGQTYILEKDGALYESQVSSFAGLGGMDLTPGHVRVEAGNLQNALGESLSTSAATRCFACHTTYSSADSKFDASRAVPGVHCEACHGPGVEHINAIHDDQSETALSSILNPAHLSPIESVDFCGACHRTALDVVVSAEAYGPINIRFQPYRLEKSRCWGTQGDARLACIACHDPHKPLVRTASSYDERCMKCHITRSGDSPGHSSSPPVCPKSTANCTTCHMPKYDVPEMHAKFTDHFIRVVRDGESYPN